MYVVGGWHSNYYPDKFPKGPQVIMGYQAGMKGNSSQAVMYWNIVAPIIHNQLRLFLDFFI